MVCRRRSRPCPDIPFTRVAKVLVLDGTHLDDYGLLLLLLKVAPNGHGQGLYGGREAVSLDLRGLILAQVLPLPALFSLLILGRVCICTLHRTIIYGP